MDFYDNDRQFGEAPGQPYGQEYGIPYGQQYIPVPGQQYGAPYGQQFIPGQGQQFGVGYGPYGYGFPFGGAGQFPPGQPSEGFPGMQQPPGPPPSATPSITTAQTLGGQGAGIGVYAVDPGALFGCRFRYTYIWLENGMSFWMWPTFIGRRSIAGYRWTGFRWVYFGIDVNDISAFTCY